jgi:LEA14-like dessication related protein
MNDGGVRRTAEESMRRLIVLSAVTLAGAAGCATLARQAFQEPVVSVRDVRLNGIGLTGGSVDVALNVYNPNNYRLDATRITYRLLFDTVTFADGALTEQRTVQARDTLRLVIPVNFTYRGVGEAGRQILNTGSVNYRLLGDVTVGSPLGNFTIPYSTTGRFSTLGGNR